MTVGRVAGVWFAIAVICLSVFFFACFLNWTLYQKQAPFFDSVRYYDRLYEVVSISGQSGIKAGIQSACLESSTICFPYLLGALAGLFTGPSRYVGVGIEVFYLGVFLISFSIYLRRVANAGTRCVIACLIPFLLLNALYRSTAGIADLRVDLPFALLYASIGCWWQVARAVPGAQKASDWDARSGLPIVNRAVLMAGVLAGIACLTRALAPVYLVAGFFPVVVFQMLVQKNRLRLIAQTVVVVLVCCLISAWFYWVHFKFLRFYYLEWNTDANAGVPLLRSLKHGIAMLKSIGVVPALFFAGLFVASRTTATADRNSRPGLLPGCGQFCWLATAPLLLLIISGSDINPFVSLPGALSLAVCLVAAQFSRIRWWAKTRPVNFWLVNSLWLGMSAGLGFYDHSVRAQPTLSGHQQIVESIMQDGSRRGRRRVTCSVVSVGMLSTASLEGMFQYEYESRYVRPDTVVIDGVEYVVSHRFLLPAEANWNRLSGKSDIQKIQNLKAEADRDIDYLVLPTRASVPELQHRYSHVYGNRYCSELLTLFETNPQWQPVSGEIEVEPGVRYRVFNRIPSK